jgi:hypothetical protein
LKSYQFEFSYSNCLFNDQDITIHNNINNIISNFTNKILQSSLVFDKEIIISSLLSNCTSIVYISDLMKNEIKIIFYALFAFLVGLTILIISILYWKGYLNWIIYYKKSELYFLPNEVSWSLLLQLKYPYKVDMTFFSNLVLFRLHTIIVLLFSLHWIIILTKLINILFNYLFI